MISEDATSIPSPLRNFCTSVLLLVREYSLSYRSPGGAVNTRKASFLSSFVKKCSRDNSSTIFDNSTEYESLGVSSFFMSSSFSCVSLCSTFSFCSFFFCSFLLCSSAFICNSFFVCSVCSVCSFHFACSV